MNLGDIKRIVDSWQDDDFEFDDGFERPHSYRGYYNEVSFERLSGRVTVAQIKSDIDRALAETFCGWKGGEYSYWFDTPAHLSDEGCAYDDDGTAMEQLIAEMQEFYANNH
jgi:hypothetical protein